MNKRCTLLSIPAKNSGIFCFGDAKPVVIVCVTGSVVVSVSGASVSSTVVPATATKVLPPQIPFAKVSVQVAYL